MMASILQADGFHCETLSSGSLAGEVVANIANYPDVQICISATPPLAQRHARYLVKRLTAVLPDVPILAGIWGASEDRVKRLEAAASVAVVNKTQSAAAEIKRRLALSLEGKAPASSLVPTAEA
ncbi:MAG TPA: hypothetical protein VIS96_05135 [Terrimicrobiaceae bacterium]